MYLLKIEIYNNENIDYKNNIKKAVSLILTAFCFDYFTLVLPEILPEHLKFP